MIVSSVTSNITMLLYTMIYLRFMKDQTILLALSSLMLVFFSYVAHSFLALYHADLTENYEELRMLSLRNIRGFQVLILVHVIGCFWYHSIIDLDESVCKWKYGYWFTQFIADMQCGKGGRAMLYVLDTLIVLTHLLSFTYMTTNIEIGTVDFKVRISQLDVESYGILSILKMRSLDVDPTQLKITVDELDADISDSYVNYSSMEVTDSG